MTETAKIPYGNTVTEVELG